MRRSMDKALAAFACAVLIGALGAMSWNGDRDMAVPFGIPAEDSGGAGARDEIVREIERIHSVWRSNDARASGRKGEAGNP
jgi:hypothetical protein